MPVVEVRDDLSDAERSEVAALVDNAAATRSKEVLSENKRLQLDRRSRPFSAVLVRDDGGALVGYAHLGRSGDAFALETVLDDARQKDQTVGALLVSSALSRAAAEGGGALQYFLATPEQVEIDVALGEGLEISRELLQLRVELPLTGAEAPALPTRSFVVGQDELAFLGVNSRAFAEHPDQGSWTLDDVIAREKESWFDPAGFLLLEEDATLIGFCWTKVHDEPEHLGEIYVIAVDPSAQGRGLGRSLTVAGLSHLADEGLSTGMLYVDRDNEAAVRLYESLGFSLHHRDVVLSIVVEPAR